MGLRAYHCERYQTLMICIPTPSILCFVKKNPVPLHFGGTELFKLLFKIVIVRCCWHVNTTQYAHMGFQSSIMKTGYVPNTGDSASTL